MGVFEQFPYVNMHEMNLDWLLKKMKELDQAMETFKATESLKFADPIIWDITTQYQKSTIVLDPTGNAYLSLQAVPVGIQLNNDEYWLEIFNFTDYTRTANQNLTVNVETNTTRATAAYQVDDWLIWNDVLYRVTSAIAIDDALIVAPDAGSNIVHFTVEDFIKAFITYATGLIQQYKNDIDASELAYRQQLAQDIANTTASLQAQLDLAISGATVDSEVINARLGADGITYSTLGNAIRTQLTNNAGAVQSIDTDKKFNQFSFPSSMWNDLIDIADPAGNILVKVDSLGFIKSPDFNSHKTAFQGMLYTLANYNFAVCDEDNNIVFGIKELKSITNNKLFGKTISILGDSISTYDDYIPTGYATYYPRGNVDNVDKTWWKKLIDYFGLELLTNASWSGSKVTGNSQGTAICGCSDARISDLKGPNNETPDIILCYIGTNDWADNVDLGSFDSHDPLPSDGNITNIAEAYALMLYKIRNAYPKAIIYCMTELEGRHTAGDTSYPIENNNGTTIHDVNHTITEIAHIFGAKIIDLNTCGIHYWNIASYTTDGHLHPNANGMVAVKDAAVDILMNTYNNIL